ncbi:Thioredoxin [Flavobacteriaceae bacterium 3519-10]|nr:Thioredoxin [Flavobacteriaceae bacterium 3519-10]
MKKYWQLALTFDEYMQESKRRVTDTPRTDEYFEYYELGLHRMERTLKTFKIDEQMLETLKSKDFVGRILIISEPWCGDASATVPAVATFFEAAGIDVKVFLRDSDTSLIDQYLTNGTQSIPKILILDQDLSVKNVWGPRPEFGNQLLAKFKENEASYPREEFYNDLQVYYAKNRGRDAINEIINLI